MRSQKCRKSASRPEATQRNSAKSLLGIFLVLSWGKSIQGMGVKTGVENLKKLKNN